VLYPPLKFTKILPPDGPVISGNLYFVNIIPMFLNAVLRQCMPWSRASGYELDQASSFPYTGSRREP
jgi:hypothetical protein